MITPLRFRTRGTSTARTMCTIARRMGGTPSLLLRRAHTKIMAKMAQRQASVLNDYFFTACRLEIISAKTKLAVLTSDEATIVEKMFEK